MDTQPLFTQDRAKGKYRVTYAEATAQSNNGPHLYLVCMEQCLSTMGEATFY